MGRVRLVTRRNLLRLGPPVAFLLAATVGVLLVRAALHHHHSSGPPTTAVSAPRVPISQALTTAAPGPAPQYYRIESGDTFSSVALKFNTTVDELRALNPNVDPQALTVGQRIRVS